MASYLGLIQHIEVDVYGELGLLKVEPVKVVFKENAKLYSAAAPHCIPIPLLPRAEEELKRMAQNGIIDLMLRSQQNGLHCWCQFSSQQEK